MSKQHAENCYRKASAHLANANAAAERGQKVRAEKLYNIAQYWLDLANKAAGNN